MAKKKKLAGRTTKTILLVGTDHLFLTPTVFSGLVETKVLSANIGHLEAVQLVCEERHIEYESVKALLTKPLKAAIHVEATNSNLLKK